ncbi:peptidyl-prolyl cis-trans isomerase FKBP3-like [Stigmatopora argus]
MSQEPVHLIAEQLRRADLPKKDLIKFVQDNAQSFPNEHGDLKNVPKTAQKEQLTTPYRAVCQQRSPQVYQINAEEKVAW